MVQRIMNILATNFNSFNTWGRKLPPLHSRWFYNYHLLVTGVLDDRKYMILISQQQVRDKSALQE